jgi:hypothetical protein
MAGLSGTLRAQTLAQGTRTGLNSAVSGCRGSPAASARAQLKEERAGAFGATRVAKFLASLDRGPVHIFGRPLPATRV